VHIQHTYFSTIMAFEREVAIEKDTRGHTNIIRFSDFLLESSISCSHSIL